MHGKYHESASGSSRYREAWNLIQAILKNARRLLISVPIILLPVLLFLLLNEATKALPDPLRRSEIAFDAAYLLGDRFLEHLTGAASSWRLIAALFLGVNFVGGWITLIGFTTIIDAIAKNRADIVENAKSIKLHQLAKFILSQAVLYPCYFIVAALLYLAVYQLYSRYQLTYIHYAFVALILLIPLHFGLTSMYALILLLRTNLVHEMRLLRTALWPTNIAKLYSFYLVRLAIEGAVAAATYFILRMFIPTSLAIIAAGFAALLVPFAFLRVSSLIFKLTLLSSDPVAQALALKSLSVRPGDRGS
jgi:hypothetical protein